MNEKKILFIHGAWVTSLCWEPFIGFFQEKGYECLAPNWPYDDRPVAELRADPAPELVNLGISEIVAHYASIIGRMDTSPIIVGHSFGGLFTQILLDRGMGVAGVALDSAPPKGVLPTPGAIKGSWEPLSTWQGWKRVLRMSPGVFTHTFANGFGGGQASAEAYEKYAVPTPGRIFFQAATAVFHNTLAVNYKNHSRAPLLLTAGGQDRILPVAINRANFKKYSQANAHTDFIEFPNRSHTLIMEPGWEEVAESIYSWLSKWA